MDLQKMGEKMLCLAALLTTKHFITRFMKVSKVFYRSIDQPHPTVIDLGDHTHASSLATHPQCII